MSNNITSSTTLDNIEQIKQQLEDLIEKDKNPRYKHLKSMIKIYIMMISYGGSNVAGNKIDLAPFHEMTSNAIPNYESFIDSNETYLENANIYDLYINKKMYELPNIIIGILRDIIVVHEKEYISMCLLLNEKPNLKIKNYIYHIL